MILLGLIVLDMTITLHFIIQFSFDPTPTNAENWKQLICQIDGSMTAYTFVTTLAYYGSLSHCIIQSIFEFQAKNKVPGWVYHVLPHSAGITYVILALSYHDIGKGVMLTCAMEYGSFIE